MLSDDQFYLKKVEKTVNQLRCMCLGQSTHLTAVLPDYLRSQPQKEQAVQISEQILFALTKIHSKPVSPEQLILARRWLQGAAFYLLQECNAEDQTFKELKRLLELPLGVRSVFFQNFCNGAYKEYMEEKPPALFKDFDGAIWWLLRVQRLAFPSEEMHNKLVSLL